MFKCELQQILNRSGCIEMIISLYIDLKDHSTFNKLENNLMIICLEAKQSTKSAVL